MDRNIIISIINNGILLLSMGIIYSFLPLEKSKNKRYFYEIIIGLLLSGVVLMLMVTTFTVSESKGIVLDTRSILLSISTFFFGFIPGLLAAVTASIYRLHLGGGGTFTGILVIFSSFFIGYFFRVVLYQRCKHRKHRRELTLYLLGLTTHITMMLLFLLLPKEVRFDVIRETAPYVLILFPIIGVVYGALMFQRQDNLVKNQQRLDYLEKFQKAIKEAPIPMIIHQEDGQIIIHSKAWLEFSGYEKEDIKTIKEWAKKAYKDEDYKKILKDIEQLYELEDNLYEGEYKVQKKNGDIRIWDFYSSNIGSMKDDQPAILSIANDITEQKNLEKELRVLSYKDELTDLYNRRFYEEEIKRLNTKRNYPITLLLGDVNHLKETNDNYGHIEGDHLLKTVAESLKEACREDDIIARVGGDEFIIILPKTNEEQAKSILDRIYKQLSTKEIKGAKVSVSFGQSTLSEEQANVEEAFIKAEDNMYIKKKQENEKK
jgi:diguanylate cyclase (GGDEF)-like protein/PAS domain S-box-containing protein